MMTCDIGEFPVETEDASIQVIKSWLSSVPSVLCCLFSKKYVFRKNYEYDLELSFPENFGCPILTPF